MAYVARLLPSPPLPAKADLFSRGRISSHGAHAKPLLPSSCVSPWTQREGERMVAFRYSDIPIFRTITSKHARSRPFDEN